MPGGSDHANHLSSGTLHAVSVVRPKMLWGRKAHSSPCEEYNLFEEERTWVVTVQSTDSNVK